VADEDPGASRANRGEQAEAGVLDPRLQNTHRKQAHEECALLDAWASAQHGRQAGIEHRD
jgi:hypothetical protein